MVPAEAVTRFRADLEKLTGGPPEKLGVAVSGGPDSLALLLLAAAAYPGGVHAATVDHGLRPESAQEAEFVSTLCAQLGIPAEIIKVSPPAAGNVQAWARHARYEALNHSCRVAGIRHLATAHHMDDQAETFVMRLMRGAGVGGLAGVRRISPVPVEDRDTLVVRPLLGWRRSELAGIVKAAGVNAVEDPSNADERFARARIRRHLKEAPWLDPAMVALSAANLAEADEALDWATQRHWDESVRYSARLVLYRPEGAPAELQRRVVSMILVILGGDGRPEPPRGPDLSRLLDRLRAGGTATLHDVKCSGGSRWRFEPAPPRRDAAR